MRKHGARSGTPHVLHEGPLTHTAEAIVYARIST